MFTDAVKELLSSSGFAALDLRSLLMIAISCILIYLAIGKKFEPDRCQVSIYPAHLRRGIFYVEIR